MVIKKNIVNRYNVLSVILIVMLPFTSLRYNHIGVAEIIILLMFINLIFQREISIRIKKCQFTKFWVAFIILLSLGFSYNCIINAVTMEQTTILFDTLAYIFILLTVITFETLISRNKIDEKFILKYAFLIASTAMIILFLVGNAIHGIGQIKIFYFGRFSPFATNIHHTAMFLLPLPFIGLLIIDKVNCKLKIVILFFVFFDVILAIKTGAVKATIGLCAGFIVFSISFFLKACKKIEIRACLILILASIVFIFVDNLSPFLRSLFIDNDINGVRLMLYTTGFDLALKSPLLGMGPGSHIYFDYLFLDSHQTLLTIFLQTGIIGLILTAYLFIKIVNKTYRAPPIIGALSGIGIYVLGGDIMRRLPIWVFLILLSNYDRKGMSQFSQSVKPEIISACPINTPLGQARASGDH